MKKPALSFEVFPPKTDKGMEKMCGNGGVIDHLYELNPESISCTYGAGGSNVGRNMEVMQKLVDDKKTLPVTHFTCIGATKEEIRERLQSYLDRGVNRMLALRGDLPYGLQTTGGDFQYANELVEYVREEFGDKFTIGIAGSPEGHINCRDIALDISHLKLKQDAGADYITTQLCWDITQFKRWLDDIRKAGITLPVHAGVMPVLDQAQTINMALSHNGCVMPRRLSELISLNWIFPDPFNPNEDEEAVTRKKAAFKEAGIEYTVQLIEEFKKCGVEGIHLYALNKYPEVTRICKESGLA